MKAGKIVKSVFIILLLAFFALIFVRIFMMEDKRTLKEIYPTDGAKSAYSQLSGDAFTYHKMFSEISSDGYFSAYAMVYCASEKEMQLTVKYNDSLLEKYLLGADPENFRWELTDGDGNTVSVGRAADTAEKYQYNYERIVFEGVEITDETELKLKLCCDDVDYPTEGKEPDFYVHTKGTDFEKYRLSSSEKELLAEK